MTPDRTLLQHRLRERGGDSVGEPVGPAVPPEPGELDQLLSRGGGEFGLGGPAFQQPQHRGG